MKKSVILATAIMAIGCHHTMEPWPSDGDKQNVSLYVRTRSLNGIAAAPASYQFFIYDPLQKAVSQYAIVPKSDNTLSPLKLFPGNYAGYCVTNAENADNWIYAEDFSAEEIFLKSGKTETQDHLLGQCEFEVFQDEANTVIFDLERKVGMLKVTIENIPEWLSDLQINLGKIPQKMNLVGEYEGSTSITKNISIPDENGTSVTTLLVFPPKEKAILTLSSNSMAFVTSEHPIETILANRQTEIRVIFKETHEVDITTQLADWDETILQEEDWEIAQPEGPCTGSGNGINLIENGSFEEEFANDAPNHWELTVSDSKKYTPCAVSVTSPVHEGEKAVQLRGKTYMYQDIPVTGGQCYQLKMHVYAESHDIKWKCYSTWKKGSNNLTSGAIQTSDYQYETQGYIDIYNGQVFRAPDEATILRMEIRTYMEPVDGEGLYVDAVSVEAVD